MRQKKSGGSMSQSELKDGGSWNPSEKKIRINILEPKAVHFAIQSLTKHEQNIYVRMKSDNTTVLAYLNKNGGTRSNNKAELDSLSIQNDYDYCGTFVRNTECARRLTESSDEGYQ